MGLDLEQLLAPVSEDRPCGEHLEYDPEFMEVMRLSQGGGSGGTVAGAEEEPEEPNWKDIRSRTLALLERTRDLRLGVLLTLSSLETEGVGGFRDGLGYIRGLIERQWSSFWPQLDADDNNDPTERVMALDPFAKAPGTFGDPWRVLDRLRSAPLTNSRQIGRFSLRDIMVARGEFGPPSEEGAATPDMNQIAAAFADTPDEDFRGVLEAVDQSVEHFDAIDHQFTELVGAGQATDLVAAKKVLREIQKVLHEQRDLRDGVAPSDGDEGAAEAEGASTAGGGGSTPLRGEIASRQDVLMAFDKILRYYEKAEPASPVPLLIQRARRMVSMTFIEIIRDMTPDSMSEVEKITGFRDEQGES
ncbi:MAG: type VI secretion system protein TssA [Phycisphaerales bacterium]|nr:type VI secretion system protein TssA [Phycisphaerales bacterium]